MIILGHCSNVRKNIRGSGNDKPQYKKTLKTIKFDLKKIPLTIITLVFNLGEQRVFPVGNLGIRGRDHVISLLRLWTRDLLARGQYRVELFVFVASSKLVSN